jgi:hypothetical protein
MKFRRFSLPFLSLQRSDTQETVVNEEYSVIPEEDEDFQTDTLTAEQFAKLVGIEIKEEYDEMCSLHTSSSYTFPKLDLSIFTPPSEQSNPLDMTCLSRSLPEAETNAPISRRRYSDSRIEKKGRFTVEKQVTQVRKASRFEFVKESRPRLSSVDSGINIL